MCLLLQCENAKLGGWMRSVNQRAIAEIHDGRPIPRIGCPPAAAMVAL